MATSGARDQLGRRAADPDEILRALGAHRVDYLVIGGIAARVHGNPRTTLDVDVMPSPDAENLRRLGAALEELEARAVDGRGRELELDLSHPESLAIGNYFLTTRAGALDLFSGSRPDLTRFRDLRSRAVEVKLGDLVIPVVGEDDFVAMKRETGREKDLRDIAAVTEVRRRRSART